MNTAPLSRVNNYVAVRKGLHMVTMVSFDDRRDESIRDALAVAEVVKQRTKGTSCYVYREVPSIKLPWVLPEAPLPDVW